MIDSNKLQLWLQIETTQNKNIMETFLRTPMEVGDDNRLVIVIQTSIGAVSNKKCKTIEGLWLKLS